MSPHQYLISVLNSQKMPDDEITALKALRNEIEVNLRAFHGNYIRFYYGGSYGKNTMIQAAFDLDIVMCFPSDERRTLRELFISVRESLKSFGYFVKPKNVALRLPGNNDFHLDIVPARAFDDSFQFLNLYRSETGTTRQTSIKAHIDSVRSSGAREIIKLIKLWRLHNNLPWQSFALEQTVIRALNREQKNDYGRCVLRVLQYITRNIENIRLVDPANTYNVIEMSSTLRKKLRSKAALSLKQNYWENIIW